MPHFKSWLLLIAAVILLQPVSTFAQGFGSAPQQAAAAPNAVELPVAPLARNGWYSHAEFGNAMLTAKKLGMPIAIMYQMCESDCPLHNRQRDTWMQSSELNGFVRVVVDTKGAGRPPIMTNLRRQSAGKEGNTIPMLFLGSPEGKLYGVVPYESQQQQLAMTAVGSLKQHGPYASPGASLELWGELAKGVELWNNNEKDAALRHFQPLAQAKQQLPDAPVAIEFAKYEPAVAEFLSEKLDAVKGVMAEGNIARGRTELTRMVRKYKGFEVADQARDILSDAPRSQPIPVATAGPQTAEAGMRTWTAANGKHTMQGELVATKQGWIQLRQAGGKLLAVDASKLSDDDQAFIRNWEANQ